MLFDINKSYTSKFCLLQYQFNLDQMHKTDARIAELRSTLKEYPSWDYCVDPYDREIVEGLLNKIESLSDIADNYERSADYWGVQLSYAEKREKSSVCPSEDK